jgi:6-pyruvoyltetrahydropterin/6-carboxytetrahydropterin synthase
MLPFFAFSPTNVCSSYILYTELITFERKKPSVYVLKSEHSFDSAHFLANYEGKCRRIHGHRWRVIVEIMSATLNTGEQLDGMIVDFSKLKKDIKEEVDYFDHALIIETGSLKPSTLTALEEEAFRVIEVEFRPTAERFSKYFYDRMTGKGYQVKSATVYETPTNSASYEEDPHDAV